MAILLILLVLFLVVGGLGLAIKGLVWLAIIGGALFLITLIVGAVRRPWVKR